MMHSTNTEAKPQLAPSDSATCLEQPEGSDSEANPIGRKAKAGSESIGGGSSLEDVPGTPIERDQEGDNTEYPPRSNTQADQYRRCQPMAPIPPARPFQKWMRTLHKRVLRQQEMMGYDGNPPPWLPQSEHEDIHARQPIHHRHSSSDSSFAFVTAVKSASVGSVTGLSLLTRSRQTTIRSSRGPRTDRSSRASFSGPRVSEDSFVPEKQAPVDPAVVERALKRRRILEELISTEEGYIGDLRFLMNVYVTILASLLTTPVGLRSAVNQNLNDIVELHEEMLGQLHRAVPDSEHTPPDFSTKRVESDTTGCAHRRWRSLDVVPEGRNGSLLRDAPGLVAEPQAAAEVAQIFLKRINRFFIYEEYGAKYELMIKDVAAAPRTMPGWASYQKGLEVLASSLGSADSRDDHSGRALTLADLLVKPIQRVCRYPLLLSELLKHTPVIDCPYSHMEIENALIRFREATAEINRATTDSRRAKSVLKKTWTLQDRLAFPGQQPDAASKNRIRLFGHVKLCGALHVCWQSRDGVNGQYMVALLYREWFCLATAGRGDQIYTIQACLALDNIRVEEVDNGRGLQCHTARHCWKIVFLSDSQLYELVLTACSPKEELEWRARLGDSQQAANTDSHDQLPPDMFSFLALNIKSLGTVFRKPGTIARKISIHRATTIGPRSPLYQVILKNTSAEKEVPTSSHASINRSQSLLTTNSRIPVLAPARAERARLEALLSDVWTRDILPFPGMTARSRSEHLVRASASSMMRKLSAVSIPGSFTRRSASLASLQQKEKEAAAAAAEITRRASEGGYTRAHAQQHADDAAYKQQQQPYQPSNPGAEDADDGLVTMHPAPRRVSAPDELEKTAVAAAPEEPRARASSSSESVVRRPSAGELRTGCSPRPSLQHSDLSEISASAREAERRLAGKRQASSPVLAQGEVKGQGKGQRQGKTPSRSRSLGFSGKRKLAKKPHGGEGRRKEGVGVGVVEGIKGWFR